MLAYAAFYAQAYVIFNAAVFKAHGAHGAFFNAKAAFYAFFAVNLYFGGYAQFAADDEKQALHCSLRAHKTAVAAPAFGKQPKQYQV